MRTLNRRIAIIVMAATLTACGSCTKPANVQPLPETPFTKAARAADDIAGALKLLVRAETNLEQQKLITPQEGLQVLDAIAAVVSANTTFTNDIEAAKASGDKSAAVPTGKAVIAAVGGLTRLTIKNEKARQTFDAIMKTINIAVGVLEGFVGQ